MERAKNNELVVEIMTHNMAVNVAGEKLTGLPSAIAEVMKSSSNSGLKLERDQVKTTFPMDMIVTGAARLTINVKHNAIREDDQTPKAVLAVSDSGDEPDSGPGPTPGGDEPPEFAPDSAMISRTGVIPERASRASKNSKSGDASSSDQPAAGSDANAPASGAKPADFPAGPGGPDMQTKTVVRQPQVWIQRTQADFAKGIFSGVSASSENKLELAPTLKKLVETPEQYVWCLALGKDGVYAGTGNAGKIYHITDTGDSKLFYDTGELEVNSLARDSQGNIYAGTSPHGRVFKISPDGKGALLGKTEERYVLGLAIDGKDDLYAGVGDAGKIYRAVPGGELKLFSTINEQQILSLSWDPHGSLIAGTGINGVVYRVDSGGKASPIFDAPENSITAVVSDGDGNVYAGTSPKGVVFKIKPDGRSETVYSKAERVLSMVSDARNSIYAVSDGSLAKISPTGAVTTLNSGKDKVQFLALAFNDQNSTLYAGTGNIGSIYVSKCCDVTGAYESPVHDAKMVSRWGRVKWNVDAPSGTVIELRTRTGNVAVPDSTWTGWSQAYEQSSGD